MSGTAQTRTQTSCLQTESQMIYQQNNILITVDVKEVSGNGAGTPGHKENTDNYGLNHGGEKSMK